MPLARQQSQTLATGAAVWLAHLERRLCTRRSTSAAGSAAVSRRRTRPLQPSQLSSARSKSGSGWHALQPTGSLAAGAGLSNASHSARRGRGAVRMESAVAGCCCKGAGDGCECHKRQVRGAHLRACCCVCCQLGAARAVLGPARSPAGCWAALQGSSLRLRAR